METNRNYFFSFLNGEGSNPSGTPYGEAWCLCNPLCFQRFVDRLPGFPSWSKGVDLRSTADASWVQIPLLAL